MAVIVHVEDYFDPEAGYQINELLLQSRKSSDKYYLITSNDMSPFHKKVDLEKDKFFTKQTGVEVIRLPHKKKFASRILYGNLFSTIKSLNPDLVFLHGIGDFKDLILFTKKKKYTIVRDCHMSWIASKNKFNKLYFQMFKFAFAPLINKTQKYKAVFYLGGEEKEYLETIGIKQKKITELLHGYNEKNMFFSEKQRKIVRNHYNITEDEIVISYIGKFDDAKRPDLLFDIMNNVNSNHKIKLLFIGPKDESYLHIFNQKSKRSKYSFIIDDSKKFNELYKFYSASDICIFPKQTSLSSLHAQVCGCSVIMENYDSNKERVIDQKNLYSPDDFKTAATIIERIVSGSEYEKERNLRMNLEKLSKREYKNQVEIINTMLKE